MTTSNHDSSSHGDSSRWLPMNPEHIAFLASERWARMLEQDLLPWLLAGGSLGDEVLEIGPGPGLTTDILRKLAPAVVAVELDPLLARQLSERLAGSHVTVVHGDASRTAFEAGRFSCVTCFHALHHVPTALEQDALLAEVARVLRRGGAFVCADALDTESMRLAHARQRETFVPLDPATLDERLRSVGFSHVEMRVADYQLLVRATR